MGKDAWEVWEVNKLEMIWLLQCVADIGTFKCKNIDRYSKLVDPILDAQLKTHYPPIQASLKFVHTDGIDERMDIIVYNLPER